MPEFFGLAVSHNPGITTFICMTSKIASTITYRRSTSTRYVSPIALWPECEHFRWWMLFSTSDRPSGSDFRSFTIHHYHHAFKWLHCIGQNGLFNGQQAHNFSQPIIPVPGNASEKDCWPVQTYRHLESAGKYVKNHICISTALMPCEPSSVEVTQELVMNLSLTIQPAHSESH